MSRSDTPQVTLADVALLAGVSLATASRALGQARGRTVGPELTARVKAAALELNYTPNAHAQAMRRGSTTIGLVVHDIADPVTAAVAAGLMAEAERHGQVVTIAATGGSPDREVTLVEALRQQRVRAVVLAGSRFRDTDSQRWLQEEIAGFRAGGGRVVVIGRRQPATDTVEVDNHGGAAALARTLWSLGYRRFAVLAGPDYLVSAQDRVDGFRTALAGLGDPPPAEWVLESGFDRDGGYAAMSQLLDHGIAEGVDCVFAASDAMAVGAMAALREHGLSVPQDLAVAGFDDIPLLRDVLPALTTVRLPLTEIGRLAAELTRIDPTPDGTTVSVAAEVVVRASTPGR